MSCVVVLHTTLGGRNLLALHQDQCTDGKESNLSHKLPNQFQKVRTHSYGCDWNHGLPNQLQRCCVNLGKFHEFPSKP